MPDFPSRKQLRLRNYDYTSAGFYFVTICIQNRKHLFGKIINSNVGADPCVRPNVDCNTADPRVRPNIRMETQISLNNAGLMAESIWKQIPGHYPGVKIDKFVIMPNHIHGIIILNPDSQNNGQAQGPAPTMTLSNVIQRFKSITTTLYRNGVHKQNWVPFDGKFWQRNFYERIIRNDNELNKIRQYIRDNPINWENDTENITPRLNTPKISMIFSG